MENTMPLTKKDVLSHIDLDYMIKLRRELHMYPELDFELTRTLALIRRELDAMGIEYTEKFGDSSIVAYINRQKPAFSIGIRADTDALPITETSDVPYKSQIDGRMHACGHDAHTAALLGTAKALNAVRDELDCRVVMLFQPAEETEHGAEYMVRDGVCDEFDVIIACHIDNRFDCGTVHIGRAEVFAAIDSIDIEFFGRSSHAAYPHNGADAIAMGVKAYTDIQMAFARCYDPFALRVVNIGKFDAGSSCNSVADYSRLRGTVRTYDAEVREKLFAQLETIVRGAAETFGGSCRLNRKAGEPAMYNDARVADALLRSAADTLGAENAVELRRPLMCSEDFIQYTYRKPSVYYFLGTRNEAKGFVNMTHSNNCDIDERALGIAAAVNCGFVFDNANGVK